MEKEQDKNVSIKRLIYSAVFKPTVIIALITTIFGTLAVTINKRL